jgi:acyl carrier protein
MNNQQILTELKTIVKPYIKNDEAFENFTEETNFITDLNINSANLVDIVLDVEEAFDIIIDNESMEKMINAKAALSIIQTKLGEK